MLFEVGSWMFVFSFVLVKEVLNRVLIFMILLVECIFGLSIGLMLGKWVKGMMVFLMEICFGVGFFRLNLDSFVLVIILVVILVIGLLMVLVMNGIVWDVCGLILSI